MPTGPPRACWPGWPPPRRPVTAAELHRFARQNLRLDCLFWGTQEPHYSRQVLPLLRGLSSGERPP